MAERLAYLIARYRWVLLAAWLCVMAVAGLAAPHLPGRLSGGGWDVPGSQSQAAAAALRSGFASRGASNLVVVVTDDRDNIGSGQFAARADRVVRAVGADPRLHASGSYGWATLPPPARQQFVGQDRRTTITFLALRDDNGTARRVLPAVQAGATDRFAPAGLHVSLVSADSFFGEINTLSQVQLERAELIALPLLLFILVLLFRGIVATAVSFVVSATALTLTFAVLALLAEHVELSIFVQNAATMIGLGVSVDYSLFMITRYSGELAAGHDRLAALARTLRTSGEAVASAGLIVVLAMSTLFLVELNVIASIALGVVVVVAFAVIASVLVLPAVLYLLGDRVLKGALPWSRVRPAGGGRWYGLAVRIMRRPASFLIISVLALLALAAPAAGLRTFTPDARILPQSSPVRAGYDTMAREFGAGAASPVEVVVASRGPDGLGAADVRAIAALRARLAGLPHVTRVEPGPAVLLAAPPPALRATAGHFVSAGRRTVVLEVISDGSASSAASLALLGQVRADARQLPGGLRADVGGETAAGADANTLLGRALPRVLLAMLTVIYLMLLLAFRSVLLPVKAILMNLLSVGATFGVLVLVFQHGPGARLLGAASYGYLQNFVPILLLAILFSLSTDYEVFLLSAIREEYRGSGDNAGCVAAGLARTAPLISGAALLMIAVFAAFAFTGILPIKQLGFGLAVAIALDATVIRLVVVPSAMKLMGRWNWWLPGRRARPAETVPPAPAVLPSSSIPSASPILPAAPIPPASPAREPASEPR